MCCEGGSSGFRSCLRQPARGIIACAKKRCTPSGALALAAFCFAARSGGGSFGGASAASAQSTHLANDLAGREVQKMLQALGSVLGGADNAGTPLRASLLTHLRQAQIHATSTGDFATELHEAGALVVWPCTSWQGQRELANGTDHALQGDRTALWHTVAWLRKCGVQDVPLEWPEKDEGWSTLRLQIMNALEGLANVRGDHASLICPRRRSLQIEDGERKSSALRCPRCGYAVAADRAAQLRLLELRRDLVLMHMGQAAPLEREDVLLQQVDEAKDDACISAEVRAEEQLVAASAAGLDNSLVAAVELFHCGTCQLEGLNRFLARESRRDVDAAIGSLIVLKCAASLPDAVSAGQLLENIKRLEAALWQGVGFPILHESAAHRMLELLSSGRLAVIARTDLSSSLCDADQGFGAELHWSHSPESSSPALDSSSSKIWDYEQEILRRWGSQDALAHWDPLEIGMAYLDLSTAVDEPVQAALSLGNAALWLREALRTLEGPASHWVGRHFPQKPHGLRSAIRAITGTAHKMAISMLAPGSQLLVLRACSLALRPANKAWRESELHLRLLAVAKQSPFWSPPLALVSNAIQLSAVAARLHSAYALRASTMDPEDLGEVPQAAAAFSLGLYEAALAEGRQTDASILRSQAMSNVLHLSKSSFWHGVQTTLEGARFHANLGVSRRPFGPQWLWEESGSLESGTSYQDSFRALRGLRVDVDTGSTEVLLERPRVQARVDATARSFSAATMSAAIASGDEEAPAIALETPSQSPAVEQLLWRDHHPFQQVVATSLPETSIMRAHFLRTALALQRLAGGSVEISVRPPFPVMSKCSGTRCRSLPPSMRSAGKSAAHSSALSESRLDVRCDAVSYAVVELAAGTFQFQFDAPRLVVSVEEDHPNGPLRQLAQALMEHLSQAAELWIGVAPLRQLCTLRAASVLFARAHSELADASGTAENARRELRAAAGPSAGWEQPTGATDVVSLPRRERPHRTAWLDRLAAVHAEMLHSLGFSNLDPGSCFDDTFTFGTCCSMGEHANQCWHAGFSEERCCLGPTTTDLTSEVVQAVVARLVQETCQRPGALDRVSRAATAWLQRPTYLASDGRTRSSVLADLLDDEASLCGSTGKTAIHPAKENESEQPIARLTSGSAELVPALPAAQTPRISVQLNPTLQKKLGEPIQWEEGMVLMSLEKLQEHTRQSQLLPEFVSLASVFSQLRALRWLATRLSKYHQRTARDSTGSSGSDQETEQSIGLSIDSRAAGSARGACCGVAAERSWVLLRPEDAAELHAGQTLRIGRSGRSGIESLASEEAKVLDVLKVGGLASPSKKIHRVQLNKTGIVAYYNLSQPSWFVTVPETRAHGNACADSCSKIDVSSQEWPHCARQEETIRGLDDAGVFVNLHSFGINSGCFRDDCSHSDHFESGSPAHCAQICASIRACRWWSFWTSRSGGSCWLRRHDRHRAPMQGSLAASTDCVPPVSRSSDADRRTAAAAGTPRQGADPGRGRRAREPTLFELARGEWGIGPRHPFHQWDLVRVLEAFGRMTPSELSQQEPSALRRSALRFARRAQHLRGRSSSM